MLPFKSLDEFDFHRELGRTEGPVLVMFGAPGCGACRRAEKLLPGAADGMVGGLYKVDVQQSTGLARAYEVFHLPALFLFVDGCYHAAVDCELAGAKLRLALEGALQQPPQDEP